ncbi:MAG: hypothetical protein APR63_04175 [Desulfuromonas sp. SDB]|nr:MAG: hypothetical protein APR63_04175 [Desulfuromonas sp. SDB]
MLCPLCKFDNPPNHSFCGNCGSRLNIAKPSRRIATFLIVDMVNFTKLSEQLDPEQVKKLVQETFASLDDITQRVGGYLHQIIGDSGLFLFGIPLALEKHSERAVSAALQIKKITPVLSEQLEQNINFHMAIHSGEVFCGDILINKFHSYFTIGDPLNVTSRIENICPAGEIYVSQEIYKATSHLFNYEQVGAEKFKGKKEPVSIYRLVDQRTRRLKQRGLSWTVMPFVGREKELNLAIKCFSKSKQKLRGIIVKGEPGIGKTRFFEELMSQLQPNPVKLNIRCIPYGMDSFWTLRQLVNLILNKVKASLHLTDKISALQSVFQMFDHEHSDYIASHLTSLLQHNHQLSYQPQQLNLIYHSIFKLIEYLNSECKQTVVLVIEDLHWAPPPFIDFLEQMTGELENLDLYLILISRTLPHYQVTDNFLINLATRKSFFNIHLQPLSRGESESLIKFILNIDRIPVSLKSTIIKYSEGNPFYLEELIKILLEKGIIWYEQGKWIGKEKFDFTIPKTVNEIIMSRFDLLSTSEKTILEIASVNGTEFFDQMVFQLSGVSDRGILDRLCKYGFINYIRTSTSGSNLNLYSFSHILIKDSIYSYQLKIQRKQIHRQILHWFEQSFQQLNEYYPLIAYHADQAELWNSAVNYYYLAAMEEEKKYSFQVAEKLLTRILEIVPAHLSRLNQPQVFNYLYHFGKIASNLGKSKLALEKLFSAEKYCRNKYQRAQLFYQIAQVYQTISDYSKSKQYIDKALAFCNFNQPTKKMKKLIFNLYHLTSAVDYLTGNTTQAFTHLLQAEKYMDKKNQQQVMIQNSQMSDLLHEKGEIQQALQLRLEIEQLAHKSKNLLTLATNYNNIGIIYGELGEIEKSLNSYKKSYELEKKTGHKLGQAISSFNIGAYYLDFGVNRQARIWLNRYHELNLKINNQLGEGYYQLGLAEIEYNRANIKKSIHHRLISKSIFAELDSRQNQFFALIDIIWRFGEAGLKNQALQYQTELQQLFEKIKKSVPSSVHANYDLILTYMKILDKSQKITQAELKKLQNNLNEKSSPYENIDDLFMLYRIFQAKENSYSEKCLIRSCNFLINSHQAIPKPNWKKSFLNKYICQKVIQEYENVFNSSPVDLNN